MKEMSLNFPSLALKVVLCWSLGLNMVPSIADIHKLLFNSLVDSSKGYREQSNDLITKLGLDWVLSRKWGQKRLSKLI